MTPAAAKQRWLETVFGCLLTLALGTAILFVGEVYGPLETLTTGETE